MNKISDIVSSIVTSSELALTALVDGYMNFSAYAKLIKPEVQRRAMKPVTESSIIVALSRLSTKLSKSASISPVIYLENISVQSDLVEIAFEKTNATREKLQVLYQDGAFAGAEFFTVTHGTGEISIVVPRALKKNVLAVYRKHTPKLVLENIAGLTVRFGKEYMDIPNTFYALLKEFSLRRINIAELVSTYTELTFLISHDHLNEAFAIMNSLTRQSR